MAIQRLVATWVAARAPQVNAQQAGEVATQPVRRILASGGPVKHTERPESLVSEAASSFLRLPQRRARLAVQAGTECSGCMNKSFELRQVSWPINVGGHVVAHDVERSVCGACGRWAFDAVTLQRFELLAVQQVLLNCPFTPAIGKDARKTLGLEVATLGERLGVAEQKVLGWESDETAPPWFQLALGGLVAAALLAPPEPLDLVYYAKLDPEGEHSPIDFPDGPYPPAQPRRA